MRKEHAPPFFAPISGPARNGKQGRCAHTCYFCVAGSPAKMLVGELPKPAGLLDTLSRGAPGLRARRFIRFLLHASSPPGG